MVLLRDTATNVQRITQLEQTLAEIVGETLQRGFFGTATVELKVQDGTIQQIRRVVERVEK